MAAGSQLLSPPNQGTGGYRSSRLRVAVPGDSSKFARRSTHCSHLGSNLEGSLKLRARAMWLLVNTLMSG